MKIDHLMSRYFRLQQELSIAYNARPWHGERIDRLAGDLNRLEREIAAAGEPAAADGVDEWPAYRPAPAAGAGAVLGT